MDNTVVSAPFSAVVSDETGVELFFLAQTVSDSGSARRFCATLPPSPFVFGGSCLETTPKKIEIEQFFILLSTWPGESLGELENLGESW